MRAARLVAFGTAPVFELHELPAPVAGAGEVVVDIHAAALNRRDPWVWQTAGYCSLPVTLGSDGAGIVSAVGAGVDDISIGDAVVINPTLGWADGEDVPGPDFDILGAPLDGTFAESVRIPHENVAPMPAGWSFEHAAALSLGGLTAWRATVSCAGARRGSTLLVTGASGGVATFAIQIAVAIGARVFVTSSSPAKIERAVSLGAAGGVLHDDPSWLERLRTLAGGGVDAIIDIYGGNTWRRLLTALRDGGRLVTFGDTGGASAEVEIMDVYWHWRSIVGTTMGSPREYRALLQHVASHAWRPVIDRSYPLHEIADAARRLDAPDRFGKVVIRVRDDEV
ncbi:MAG: zinc-binding alcohol dehydrogenase/oxidoreductase [Gaiellales bacterium]|nr:zinc-binding alcohol dehydrogenase/oxidoreductase [Gaiellales bacterium]